MRVAPLALMMPALLGGCIIDELRDDDVGDAAWCDATRQWPTGYAELEDALLDALNELRVRSGQCGDVMQSPAGIVQMEPALRCAARNHATFLATQDAVGHEGSDGSTPALRVGQAQYEGFVQHELIARDFTDPIDVLEAWLASPDHCHPLYRRGVEHVGIGHSRNAAEDTTAWVVLTGRDRS